jgi:hypothetical protein
MMKHKREKLDEICLALDTRTAVAIAEYRAATEKLAEIAALVSPFADAVKPSMHDVRRFLVNSLVALPGKYDAARIEGVLFDLEDFFRIQRNLYSKKNKRLSPRQRRTARKLRKV